MKNILIRQVHNYSVFPTRGRRISQVFPRGLQSVILYRMNRFSAKWFVCAALVLILGQCQGQNTGDSFVDPNVRFVELEGWGTSLAWFGDLLGGMNENVIKEITDGLFSPSRLNMNIVRYTLGGTTPWNYTCGDYRAGGATESFRDGFEYDYDWTRDPRQIRVLQEAIKLGADTFEAFSNTPPQWLTITGCSKGNSGDGLAHVNFDAVMADDFAEYVADVIQYFHTNLSISFQTYAPFNEPSTGGWFGEGQQQEGCNFDLDGMKAVIQSLSTTFETREMDYITITAFDETMVNVELASQNWLRDQGLSHLISKVNTHGYWDLGIAQRDRLHSASVRDGHRLWMDEMGWGGSPAENMTQGLLVANRILHDLKQMLPSAWLYWQAMEDTGAWGLVQIPYDNATLDNVEYNSGYYAMLQFSQHLRKGYDLIHISNNETVAGHDATTKTLVLVIVNDEEGATRTATVDLSLFSSLGTWSSWRSSAIEHHAQIETNKNVVDKRLEYEAPPSSVTTIVVSDAAFETRTNLIPSGDFEFGEEDQTGWTTTASDNLIVTTFYVRTGDFSGMIHPETDGEEVRLTYTLEVTGDTENYYLTAWCAGGGSPTATLGVQVNDETATEVALVSLPGYHVYGLSFNAVAGDTVKVYLKGSSSSFESHIDDVVLHGF